MSRSFAHIMRIFILIAVAVDLAVIGPIQPARIYEAPFNSDTFVNLTMIRDEYLVKARTTLAATE